MRQTIASAAVVGLCIIVAGIAAGLLIGGRWSLVSTAGAAMRLDRWSGQVLVCNGQRCAEVVPAGKSADPWAVAKTQTNVR